LLYTKKVAISLAMKRRPERLQLAQTPTPIQRLSRLSEQLGREVFVKRDDLTGLLVSGNKIRKLEYLLKEAKEHGADTVVTCGGLQSNHVRATVCAAQQMGLSSIAVLRGEPPATMTGNTLITAWMGAEIRYVSADAYRQAHLVYEEIEEDLRSRGRVAYFIPEGGSTALGCWGYVTMMEELAKQAAELGLTFDSIFIAAGSGGSLAGLLAGKHAVGSSAQMVGINVYDVERDMPSIVESLLHQMSEDYGLSTRLAASDVTCSNEYVGLGYGLATDDELQSYARIGRDEGILLDPVYTGKAFLGMRDLLTRFPDRFGTHVLFIHTGGLWGVFPEASRLTRFLTCGDEAR
jgi:D-cysteine desulfhydrase